MFRRSSLIALAGLLCIACAQANAKADTDPTTRTVSVTGTATTRVVPDTIIWRVKTTTLHAKLSKAKAISDQQMAAILKTVRGLGVANADLQTGHLEVSKEHERSQYGSPGAFKHFKVTRELTIKERDVADFDAFLTGLVSSAELEVSYRLSTSDIERIRHETRLKAVEAARDKAEAMLSVLGESLGPVLSLKQGDIAGPRFRAVTNTYSFEDAATSNGAGGGTFAPGTINVKASVDAVFSIASR